MSRFTASVMLGRTDTPRPISRTIGAEGAPLEAPDPGR
jgi:hypothetical protein